MRHWSHLVRGRVRGADQRSSDIAEPSLCAVTPRTAAGPFLSLPLSYTELVRRGRHEGETGASQN